MRDLSQEPSRRRDFRFIARPFRQLPRVAVDFCRHDGAQHRRPAVEGVMIRRARPMRRLLLSCRDRRATWIGAVDDDVLSIGVSTVGANSGRGAFGALAVMSELGARAVRPGEHGPVSVIQHNDLTVQPLRCSDLDTDRYGTTIDPAEVTCGWRRAAESPSTGWLWGPRLCRLCPPLPRTAPPERFARLSVGVEALQREVNPALHLIHAVSRSR